MSPVIVFRLNHLKGTAEALAVDLSRLNILRGTKTALLTPERYDEHPRSLHMPVRPRRPLTYRSVSRTTSQFVLQIVGLSVRWTVSQSVEKK